MITFSLFNIPIRVLPWFWLTLAFIGGIHLVDSKQAILEILLFVIAGFISILVHELGHALTAKHFNQRVEIVLQAFGGYAAYSGAPLSRPKSFAVTAAGPAIQIILGIIVLVYMRTFSAMSPNAIYFLSVLSGISIFWALLNLVPVLPLDGGRLLQTILGPQRIKLTLQISMVSAIILALVGYSLTGSFLILIFMGMFAYQSFQALKENSWR
ncbi:M50 family metallopeptidase [Luteolibacter algae]|uniref:M50 family metallopeptidase n=1 Tax=Luteolibacter algae TaxID=454151 RepID=A0ABW5D5A2_9BACT